MDFSAVAMGPAIPGLRFWIVVWYFILVVGGMGLIGAWMWGRRSRWSNWDEVLRGIGTVTVSLGMLSLLQHYSIALGQVLIALAVVSFALAVRHTRPRHRSALRIIPSGQVARPRFS